MHGVYDYKLCNLFSFATWSQSADIISKEIILCVAYMTTNCAIYSLLRLGVKVPDIISKEIILCVAYMHPNCAIYSLLRLGVGVQAGVKRVASGVQAGVKRVASGVQAGVKRVASGVQAGFKHAGIRFPALLDMILFLSRIGQHFYSKSRKK
jgi:hypothetical protein